MITNSVQTKYTISSLMNQIKEAINNEKILFKDINFSELNESSIIYFNILNNQLFSTQHIQERENYIEQYKGYLVTINYDIEFKADPKNNTLLHATQTNYHQTTTKTQIIDALNLFRGNIYQLSLNKDTSVFRRYQLYFKDINGIPLDFLIALIQDMSWEIDVNRDDLYPIIKFILSHKGENLVQRKELLTLFLEKYHYNGEDELLDHVETLEDLSNYINQLQYSDAKRAMNILISSWMQDSNAINSLNNIFKQHLNVNYFKALLLNYFKNDYEKPYNEKSSLILPTCTLVNNIKEETDEVVVVFNPNISFTHQNKFKNIKIIYRLNDYDAVAGNKQLDKNTAKIGGTSIYVLQKEYDGFKSLVDFISITEGLGNERYNNYLPNQIMRFNERFEATKLNHKMILINELSEITNKNIIFI